MRKPVDPRVEGQLFDAGAVGPHAEALGVARDFRCALGAEIDPLAVGRIFRPVIGVVDIAEPRVGTAGGRDGEEVDALIALRSLDRHIGERQPIGRNPVQIIVVRRRVLVRHPARLAASDRQHIEMAVIVADIDHRSIRRQHMVVV